MVVFIILVLLISVITLLASVVIWSLVDTKEIIDVLVTLIAQFGLLLVFSLGLIAFYSIFYGTIS